MSLLARYNEYTARLVAAGKKLASYSCPACSGEIKALLPPRGQIYDSLVECPYCEELHGKIVHHNGSVETMFLGKCRARRAPAAQRGFSLVGLLASLLVYAPLIGGIAMLANAFTPTPPTAASPRYTVTTYEARIDGQRVACTETHDHQTGARERAC